MERLQPLKSKLAIEGISVLDLLRLGVDITCALEECEKQGVIHRDIKPENLFFDSVTGSFKLGDFGISCYLSRPTEGKGLPGTLTHMSPQVYRGEPFSYGDDLYALGMILYKLLNDNRIPFLPTYPHPFTPAQRDQALGIRLDGAMIPPPSIMDAQAGENHPTLLIGADSIFLAKSLASVAMRAISPDASERFSSAAEFRRELSRLMN